MQELNEQFSPPRTLSERNAIGLYRVPELSPHELHTHRIGCQILTRAALMLMHQMGIAPEDIPKYCEERKEIFKTEVEKREERVMSPVSPMPMEEFHQTLQNYAGSPCTPRTRATLMAEIYSVPKIDFLQDSPPKKFISPAPKKPPQLRKSLQEPKFTSTPKGFYKKPARIETPSRPVRKNPEAINDKTPFENRASRLRRQKMEENRKSLGGGANTTLDTSMNSSFGWR